MNLPSGFVTANTAAKKTRIWSQPLSVTAALSKPLRLQKREHEVGEEEKSQQEADRVFESHRAPSDPLARADVQPAEAEEGDRQQEQDDVEHARLRSSRGSRS